MTEKMGPDNDSMDMKDRDGDKTGQKQNKNITMFNWLGLGKHL